MLSEFRLSEQEIEQMIWNLSTGQIGLQDIPSSLLAFYAVAFDHGRESRESEIFKLQEDLNRYYRAACNGGFGKYLKTQGKTFSERRALMEVSKSEVAA